MLTPIRIIHPMLAVTCMALLCGCGKSESRPSGGSYVSSLTPSEMARLTEKAAPLHDQDTANQPAWGQAVGSLRLGLSPSVAMLDDKATTLRVRIHFENIGREPVGVPVHGAAGVNAWRLIFAAEKDGKVFYLSRFFSRDETIPPGRKSLNPGERFSEEFLIAAPLSFGAVLTSPAPLRLEALEPGERLTLRVAICPHIAPQGAKEWNAPGTLKSGGITIQRAPSPPRADTH